MPFEIIDIDLDKEQQQNDEGDMFGVQLQFIAENDPNKAVDGYVEVDKRLQVKPAHWTDEYWQYITTTFKWFLHKDDYIGCYYCMNYANGLGKKSFLAQMRLYIMTLTYAGMEDKLRDHQACFAHRKAVMNHRNYRDKQRRGTNGAECVERQQQPQEATGEQGVCPLCRKVFRQVKRLIGHIHSCVNEDKRVSFFATCGCPSSADTRWTSFVELDHHVVKVHASAKLFVCQFCTGQFPRSTQLFEHMIKSHNHCWDPSAEPPVICDGVAQQQWTFPVVQEQPTDVIRPKRRRTIAAALTDNIWATDSEINMAEQDGIIWRRPSSQTMQQSIPGTYGQTKIETVKGEAGREPFSRLTISQSQIYTCEYCGGRYLNAAVLRDHQQRYHSDKLILDNVLVKQQLHEQIVDLTETERPPIVVVTDADVPIVRKTIKPPTIPPAQFQESDMLLSVLICSLCQTKFDSLVAKLIHVAESHPEIDPFCCRVCGLIFTNQYNYRRHVDFSHGAAVSALIPTKALTAMATTFSCTLCPLVFTNTNDLGHHITLSHPQLSIPQALDVNRPDSLIGDDDDQQQPSVSCTKSTFVNQQPSVSGIKSTFVDLQSSVSGTKSTFVEQQPSVSGTQSTFVEQQSSVSGIQSTFVEQQSSVPGIQSTFVEQQPSVPGTQSTFVGHQPVSSLQLLEPPSIGAPVVVDDVVAMLVTACPEECPSVCPVCEQSLHNAFELAVHCLTTHRGGDDEDDDTPVCPNCSRMFFGRQSRQRLKEHYNSQHLRTVVTTGFQDDNGNGGDADGYGPLSLEDRRAFTCSHCRETVAGAAAKERFDRHVEQCTLDLLE